MPAHVYNCTAPISKSQETIVEATGSDTNTNDVLTNNNNLMKLNKQVKHVKQITHKEHNSLSVSL
jgi:ribulose 1,5-bisphosphate synthetase/thiazole synthase